MLRGQEGSVRTVTLARGTYSSTGFSNLPPGLSGRGSLDTSSGSGRTSSPEGVGRNGAASTLGQISVLEYLEQDDRPTFVVDVLESHEKERLNIIFANASLRAVPNLLGAVCGTMVNGTPEAEMPSSQAFEHFKSWICGIKTPTETPASPQPSFTYKEFRWSASAFRRRLRIIHGTPSSTRRSTGHQAVLQNEKRNAGAISPREMVSSPHRSTPNDRTDYFNVAAPSAGFLSTDMAGNGTYTGSRVLKSPEILDDNPGSRDLEANSLVRGGNDIEGYASLDLYVYPA
jgi:hypothetical protein